MLGGKKHEKAVAEATAAHEQAVIEWRRALAEAESARKAAAKWHADQEAERVAALEADRARYARECEERETAAAERNKAIDKLIADLAYGAVDAVHEYVSIVLSNSVYPAHFPVEHDFEFDPATAELRLKVLVPRPDTVPAVSAYRYVKSETRFRSQQPFPESLQGPVRRRNPSGRASLDPRGLRGRPPRTHQHHLAPGWDARHGPRYRA